MLAHAAGADERFPYGPSSQTHDSSRSITSFFLGSEPDLAVEMGYLAADRSLDIGEVDVEPWTELPTWIEAGAP